MTLLCNAMNCYHLTIKCSLHPLLHTESPKKSIHDFTSIYPWHSLVPIFAKQRGYTEHGGLTVHQSKHKVAYHIIYFFHWQVSWMAQLLKTTQQLWVWRLGRFHQTPCLLSWWSLPLWCSPNVMELEWSRRHSRNILLSNIVYINKFCLLCMVSVNEFLKYMGLHFLFSVFPYH